MVDTRIVLAGLWVVLVLTGLWGDVLRIFAGDFVPGEILGMQPTQGMWLGIAAVMLLPIAMILLNLTIQYPAIRWANIVVAIFVFGFNAIGLPTYPSAYDKFLLIVGLGINTLTVWYAWKWV